MYNENVINHKQPAPLKVAILCWIAALSSGQSFAVRDFVVCVQILQF